MTRTVADASRDYRKRRTDKVARYQEALERIVAQDDTDPKWEPSHIQRTDRQYGWEQAMRLAADIARNALQPNPPAAQGGE
jgi:hypothetical protein